MLNRISSTMFVPTFEGKEEITIPMLFSPIESLEEWTILPIAFAILSSPSWDL